MFTNQDTDRPKMPQPGRMHLPILAEAVLDELSEDNDPKHEMVIDTRYELPTAMLTSIWNIQVDPNLLKLPGATLKGTFLKAYRLLTEITAKVGWDALLRFRSSVFVMEEEYRNEKTAAEQQEKEKTASTTALRGTSPAPTSTHDGSVNGDENDKSLSGEDEAAAESATDDTPAIEKPEQTVGAEEVMSGSEDPQAPAESSAKKYTHFQNKRLCERWLDNLFMLLYEVCLFQTTMIFHLEPMLMPI